MKTTIRLKFNNKDLTRTVVTNNIIRCYNNTTTDHRYDWYEEANEFCKGLSKKYDIPLIKSVGIVSALSPMKSWGQNKTLAKQFLEGRRSGTFSANIEKCVKILDSSTKTEGDVKSILKGPKTVSFFTNIFSYKEEENVTVDRHAIEIAVNYAMEDQLKSINSSQYKFFKDCYIRASVKLKVRPSMVQSATWVYWREHRKNLKVVKKEDI